MSGATSVIFALFDPGKSARHGHNPGIGVPGNGTITNPSDASVDDGLNASFLLRVREEASAQAGADSLSIIFL